MFIGNHEKEHALSQKALDLEMKELELKFKEAQLNIKSKRVEEQKSIIDEHVAEQKKLASAYETSIKQTESTRKDVIREEEKSADNRAQYTIAITTVERTHKEFEITDTSKFDTYQLTISMDVMNQEEIQLLRRHDYY